MTMRNLIRLSALAGALFLAGAASAQSIVIQNARVITGGPAGVVEEADIILTDGLIAGVGVDLTAPSGATIIDGTGRVVTAGLIAPYAHLGLSEIDLDREASDTAPILGFPLSAALDAVDAYNPTSSVIAINRAGGVTRALAAPSPSPDKLFGGRAAVVDLSGRVASVTKPDAAQVVALGYAGASRAGDTRMGAWAMLREYLDEAKSYAANPRDYLLRKSEDRYFASDLEALRPVVSGDQPLMILVNGAADIRNVIHLKNDYELNVIIVGGTEAWRVGRDLAATGIPVILDSLTNLPYQFEDLGSTLENAARLNEAGVSIAFYNPPGGDTHNLRLLPQLAGNAVANGLPYDAAIAALTINPARMLGLEERLGSLEVGKAADVVLWDGDPLELTTRPIGVFIDGRAMSMENRQTKMRDRYIDVSRGELPLAYRGKKN